MIANRKQCCGCLACANICPTKCITIAYDELGFVYPVVNAEKCINCNQCKSVCPCLSRKRSPKNNPNAYGGYSLDDQCRNNSTSGGLFSEFAIRIIESGGIVFGAGFNDDMKTVHHIMVNNLEDLYKIRGSKYLQSDLGDTYSDVKKYLDNGVKVFFSGTPCQIEGLNFFLKGDYENLVTAEIICHGVPSPRLYQKYFEQKSLELGGTIKKVCFRAEAEGNSFKIRIETEEGKIYSKLSTEDSYYRLFMSNNVLRESCYRCCSKGLKKRADITLGDFWGVEKCTNNIADGKGVSLVLVHTKKGRELFNSITDKVYIKKVDYSKAIEGNPAFLKSYKRPHLRKKIEKDISSMDMNQLVNKYCREPHAFSKKLLRKLGLFDTAKYLIKSICKYK